MKSKKAQGISINTIIIAAIALIVLVVLIAVFAGRMGIWGKDMDDAEKTISCSAAGGAWASSCEGKEIIYGPFSDQDSNPGLSCCK